jgi:hypothetical protein
MDRLIHRLRSVAWVAAIATCGFVAPAIASPIFTVSQSGDAFSFEWQQTVAMASDSECVSDGRCAAGDPLVLSGRLAFSVFSFGDDSVVFNVTATNLTDLSAAGQIADWSQYNAYFNAFGFVSDPSVTGANLTGGNYFTGASTTPNFPGFAIDVCAHTSTNNIAEPMHGGRTGRCPGWWSKRFVRADLVRRFQGRKPHAIRLGGAVHGRFGLVPVPDQTSVPEPASLALLGFGVLGAALARRRRQN